MFLCFIHAQNTGLEPSNARQQGISVGAAVGVASVGVAVSGGGGGAGGSSNGGGGERSGGAGGPAGQVGHSAPTATPGAVTVTCPHCRPVVSHIAVVPPNTTTVSSMVLKADLTMFTAAPVGGVWYGPATCTAPPELATLPEKMQPMI